MAKTEITQQDVEDLNACLHWFKEQHFPNVPHENLCVAARKSDLSNMFDVRVRGSNEQLAAMDAAANFYAGEITPKATVNFT